MASRELNTQQLRLRTELELWVIDALPAVFGESDSDGLDEELREDAQAEMISKMLECKISSQLEAILQFWLQSAPSCKAKDDFVAHMLSVAIDIQDAEWEPGRDVIPTDCSLLVFDFDGTIIAEDGEDYGLSGARLHRMKSMAEQILSSETRCVLVTAQMPQTTDEVTIPLLHTSGLAALFDEPASGENGAIDPCTYWEDPSRGTIYNDEEAMGDKIRLIHKIIRGLNRWRVAFEPGKVLFLDDRAENFQGHEALGINVRHVKQDGMNAEDYEAVRAFLVESGAVV